MIYQFEGKTEKEAIQNAADELGLDKDKFDVEIVETQKGGFFKKGFVRIEVHTDDGGQRPDGTRDTREGPRRSNSGRGGGGGGRGGRDGGRDGGGRNSRDGGRGRGGGGRDGGGRDGGRGRGGRDGGRDGGYNSRGRGGRNYGGNRNLEGREGGTNYAGQDTEDLSQGKSEQTVLTLPAENDFERGMIDYLTGLVEKMNCDVKVDVQFREDGKTGFNVASSYSALLIGKKGKNLDALQLIANIYAGRIGEPDIHVVLDSENYRARREESIVQMAFKVADRVREQHSSLLLEPMNPFERRIVHTTLGEVADIITHSEGDGMYKQVRVSFRGDR
jgi:spoIIIJ-associated protein